MYLSLCFWALGPFSMLIKNEAKQVSLSIPAGDEMLWNTFFFFSCLSNIRPQWFIGNWVIDFVQISKEKQSAIHHNSQISISNTVFFCHDPTGRVVPDEFQSRHSGTFECGVKCLIGQLFVVSSTHSPLYTFISLFSLISSLQWDLRTVCWRSPSGLQYLQWSATPQRLNLTCPPSTCPRWAPLTGPATPSHLPMGLWEAP